MKGSGIRSVLLYVEQAHGVGAVAHVLEGLPRTALPGPGGFLVANYYDVSTLAHIWDRYAALVSPTIDLDVLDADFRKMGAFVADNTVATVYKLLLTIVTPDTLIARLPSLWGTYFEAPEVSVALLGPRRGRCIVQGVKHLPFIGPVAAGWIEYAFARVGATTSSVIETGWDAGDVRPRIPTFTITWS